MPNVPERIRSSLEYDSVEPVSKSDVTQKIKFGFTDLVQLI